MNCRIFLFGESEKGEMCTPLRLRSLSEVLDRLGHPPLDSNGIGYAIQALLLKRELIFFRIEEEGFSRSDYYQGVKLLYNQGINMALSAVCIPGVGDQHIIETLLPICKKLKALLILSEKDLYDYLTASK